MGQDVPGDPHLIDGQAVCIVMSTSIFSLHAQDAPDGAVCSRLADCGQTARPPGRFRVPFLAAEWREANTDLLISGCLLFCRF